MVDLRPTRWLLVVLTALLVPLGDAAAKSPYRRGDNVRVEGVVVDAAGAAVAEVDLVLTAANRKIRLGSIRRTIEGHVRVETRSDVAGGFAIDWTWNPYYNYFELAAVVPMREAGGAPVEYLVGALDLSETIETGSPVVVRLVVDRADFLRDARSFLASLDTNDYRATYQDMGKPDRVDRLELAKGEEVAWWYFEQGRSYHFVDGRLEDEIEFEPVRR